MPDFLQALHSGRVLLMDGAMGSQLQRAGAASDECRESWNVTHPERVRAVHARYANAGSQCLVTNTFQSNPAGLARYNRQSQLEEINRRGVALARAAAGADGFVLASVGPLPVQTDALARVLRSLQDADALLLETWSGPAAFTAAAWACAANANPRRLPVLLSLTFRPDPSTGRRAVLHEGPLSAAAAAKLADATGCAALGVNCGRDIDMAETAAILRDYRTATGLPLFARPNAGTPVRQGEEWVYPRSAADMASGLPALLEAGAVMVGGCCGTTPETIAAFRKVLEASNSGRS